MNFETPLTSLVWITSIVSIILTYIVSYLIIPDLGGDGTHVVEARLHHHLRHAGRRRHPGTGQGLHLRRLRHVKEVVTSADEGGASLDILSGFVAGNFSAYWLGLAHGRADVASAIYVSPWPAARRLP